MRKLTRDERLWNWLIKKLGTRRSYEAKKIYQYVIKNFGGKVIHIKYSVDASELTKAIKETSKLKGLIRKRG